MNEWLSQITDIVNRAAKEASLSEARGMFDGDSWSWAWRTVGERAAEAMVRVRPDTFGDGIEIEISAAAWIPEKRQVSAGRTYYTRYLELKALPEKAASLASELGTTLFQAWQGAQSMLPRLHEIERNRDDLMNKLRERNLLK